MSNYPRSPRDLVVQRFAWLAGGDFSAIYHSYHADAGFRSHFPSEEGYLAYAREQRLDQLELLRLEVIDQVERGNLARVLTAQVFCIKGKTFSYLDITVLRFDGDCWRIVSGKRHEVTAASEIAEASWSSVENHPETLEY